MILTVFHKHSTVANFIENSSISNSFLGMKILDFCVCFGHFCEFSTLKGFFEALRILTHFQGKSRWASRNVIKGL